MSFAISRMFVSYLQDSLGQRLCYVCKVVVIRIAMRIRYGLAWRWALPTLNTIHCGCSVLAAEDTTSKVAHDWLG